MDKKIIVVNLKKPMTLSNIIKYLKVVNERIEDNNVIICPSSIYIPYFLKHKYNVGIQNIHYDDVNPCTGEISGSEISDTGVKYVIVGHSDRRYNFFENDQIINKKVHSAIKNNLKVILCIGETVEEKIMLKTERVLKSQVLNYLKGIKSEDLKNIIIVYEPVWAISNKGNGIMPSNKDIASAIKYIKALIKKDFKYSALDVLYGGNVNEKNIESLKDIYDINGFMIGEAGCDPEKLLQIIGSC